jgi:hypothetical protein
MKIQTSGYVRHTLDDKRLDGQDPFHLGTRWIVDYCTHVWLEQVKTDHKT